MRLQDPSFDIEILANACEKCSTREEDEEEGCASGGGAKPEEIKLSVRNPSLSKLKLGCGALLLDHLWDFEAILYYKVCSTVRWIVCVKNKCGGRLNIFYKYLIFFFVSIADIEKNNIFCNITFFNICNYCLQKIRLMKINRGNKN